MSGNVELNPGPMKKCLKCEKMIPTRSNNFTCGHLVYYVAARVLALVHSFNNYFKFSCSIMKQIFSTVTIKGLFKPFKMVYSVSLFQINFI